MSIPYHSLKRFDVYGPGDYSIEQEPAGDYVKWDDVEDAVKCWWHVQEYKIWAGINKEKPTWANTGIVCGTYEDALGMIEYIERNVPERIHRIVKEPLK